MTSVKKIDELLLGCYQELYENAEPKANFKELMDNAEIIDGKKYIPYKDYRIEYSLMEQIVKKYASKISPKWKQTMFINTVYLGCSPFTK